MDQHLRGFLVLIGLDLLLGLVCIVQKRTCFHFAASMFVTWALINSLVYHWIANHQFKTSLVTDFYNQHLNSVFEWNIGLDIIYLAVSVLMWTFSRKAKKEMQKAAWQGLAYGMAFNGLYLLVLDLKFYFDF